MSSRIFTLVMKGIFITTPNIITQMYAKLDLEMEILVEVGAEI